MKNTYQLAKKDTKVRTDHNIFGMFTLGNTLHTGSEALPGHLLALSGFLEFRKSGAPEFRNPRIPDFRKFGFPAFGTSGIPDFRFSAIQEFRNFGNPDFGIPLANTSNKLVCMSACACAAKGDHRTIRVCACMAVRYGSCADLGRCPAVQCVVFGDAWLT